MHHAIAWVRRTEDLIHEAFARLPRGAYVVANELLHLINDTPTRGPYLFLASPKRMQYEDGKSHDPGSLRTFFTWMRRQADTEIPDALDLPEAITCEIEPHTQGGPTTVVLRADDCIPDVPGPMTDAEQDARLRAYEKHWKNRDAYCQDLLDALAERIGPIAHAEQSSVLTQALHYRSSNVSNSVIIVGNGNVVGDGSSSRVLQGTLAAPAEAPSRSTGSAGNTAPIHDQLNTRRRKLLQEKLEKHFNEDELRSLCFDLGEDYENLGGEGKAGKARELILRLERLERIAELIDRCRELRPKISWEDTFEISPLVASE